MKQGKRFLLIILYHSLQVIFFSLLIKFGFVHNFSISGTRQEVLTKAIIDLIYENKTDSSDFDQVCVALDYVNYPEELSDASSCPWYYRSNTDHQRYPVNITEAVLKNCFQSNYCMDTSQTSSKNIFTRGFCEPIIEVIPVIIYTAEGPQLETENVTVAYGCRLST